MPVYVLRCPDGHEEEHIVPVRRLYTLDNLVCLAQDIHNHLYKCEKKMKRVPQAAAVHFRGRGWGGST